MLFKAPRRKRHLVLAAFAVGALSVVCLGNPTARHRISKTFVQPLKRLANTQQQPPSTVEHPATLSTSLQGTGIGSTLADQRFVPQPFTQVTLPFDTVQSAGFVALLATVNPQSPAALGEFERAILPASLELATPSATSRPDATAPGLAVAFASAHQAIALYRKGALAQGDEFAKVVSDPALRIALEWVALKFDPREAGAQRLQAFIAGHPDWPTLPWLGRRLEEVQLGDASPSAIKARFSTSQPKTMVGRLALARADLATGDAVPAATIIRDIWRNDDIDAAEEAAILKNYGGLIGRDDHKYRADRLLYKEQVQPALRAAALAGSDVKLLAVARASVIGQSPAPTSEAAIAAVPKALADDPGLIFARVQRARRSDQVGEAAELLAGATRDPALLINGDAWWVERRLVARKLLDLGEPAAAFEICAQHAAMSDAALIEAEFHAGWIALRFLDQPKVAAEHFATASRTAATPISRARVAYWQGRAAEASGDRDGAAKFFESAASLPISFYGQLAGSKVGRTSLDLRQPSAIIADGEIREAIRVVDILYALGERDIALPLAQEVAKTESSDSQLAALAAILTRANDARGTLSIGKIATQRGLGIDEAAFPTFGIPGYQPLTNSADRAVVYAIARQESEFNQQSVSSAGAKGLMQLMGPTARQTATKFGLTYNDARLLSDPAFNAQLGAAHLGQLLSEQGGSYILTFAAYNAGSQRVKDWIAAYGDPRKPGVDPIDWIERIPFTETRNYVQRVFENMQIYRSRFGQSSTQLVGADLVQHGKGT